MRYTILPIHALDPVTFGSDYLALDDVEGEAWKKLIQAIHPRLLPQIKESAWLEEEEGAFCAGGGEFEFQRGQELVFDGEELVLSHCAKHFLDFLQPAADCLRIVEEKADTFENCTSTEKNRARLGILRNWWEQGYSVFVLHHN